MANVVEVIFRGIDEISKATKNIDGTLSGMARTATFVGRAFAGLFAVQQIGRFASAAVTASDAMQEMNEVLMQFTDSTAELTRVQQSLARVAVDTDTAFASTFETYVRLTQQAETLGLTERERIDIVKTLNQAMQLAGPLAGDVSALFTRMLATGEVNARSLVQLFQRAPRLAQAVADEMGTTVNKLKELGDQGKLTLETFISAMQNQSSAIQEDFEETGQTVAESMTNIGTAVGLVISKLDERLGITDALAKALQSTANSILGLVVRDEDKVASELANAVQRRKAAQEELDRILNHATTIRGRSITSSGDLNQPIDLPLRLAAEAREGLLRNAAKTEEALRAELKAIVDSRAALQEKNAATEAAARTENLYAGEAGKTLQELQRQIETLGKTEEQVILMKLGWQGASEAQLEAARTALAAKDAYDRVQESLAHATDQLSFAGEEGPVHDVELGLDELAELSESARDAIRGVTAENEKSAKAAEVAWDQAQRNMTDVLADFLANTEGGFKGLLSSFIDMLKKMVAQAAAVRIMEALFGNKNSNQTSSGDKLGAFASIIGTIFGAPRAGGGDTTPGLLHPINEQEPEFLVTANRSRVVPLSKMASHGLAAGAGATYAPTTHVHLSGTGVTPEALAVILKRHEETMLGKFRQFQLDGAM